MMLRGEKESVSVWRQDVSPASFPTLDQSIETDVCVVGAGISGLMTAYLLQKEGKSAVVVDAWDVAGGETGRTTAHITAVLDEGFSKLVSLFGEEKAKLAIESHKAAIDLIEEIVKAENIDCDFERLDGYLAVSQMDQKEDLEKEKNLAPKIGFPDCEYESWASIEGIDIGPALRFPNQATFHIGKYMEGLSQAFLKRGGRIFTRTRINKVKGGKNAYVQSEQGYRVNAKAIVVATHTPIIDWVKMHTKQAAYRTYAVAYKIPKNSYKPFLLWDLEDPYHYVRLVHEETHDFLIIGGSDHKTGQANDAESRYQQIDQWARRYFSKLGQISYRWSGQIMEPVDGLGFIGRNPLDANNVYIVTGDSGNGITHGGVAGLLLTDLIQERQNPWEKIYDPARKNMKSTPIYLKENANFVCHMVADWAEPGQARSVEDINAGEGAILRKGISKVAVYKKEDGSTQECSAVCTHLGCVVQWNSGEKSWDCPCHGSRFDTDGRILNGPAIRSLEEQHPASSDSDLRTETLKKSAL